MKKKKKRINMKQIKQNHMMKKKLDQQKNL